MPKAKLKVQPVDTESWADFERLFESPGAPKYCWCMAWRATPAELEQTGSRARKAALRKRVRAGTPIGLLGYVDGEPVAWCSVAPKSTFRNLGGEDDETGRVWSVTCLFIARPHRKLGLAPELVRAALKFAKANGAKVVEAYPVDPTSPSYRHMGFRTLFDKLRFRAIGRVGTRRHLMQKRV